MYVYFFCRINYYHELLEHPKKHNGAFNTLHQTSCFVCNTGVTTASQNYSNSSQDLQFFSDSSRVEPRLETDRAERGGSSRVEGSSQRVGSRRTGHQKAKFLCTSHNVSISISLYLKAQRLFLVGPL